MRNVSDACSIEVRCCRGEDAAATLTVFLEAITETEAADYSLGQIAAWARPEQRTVSEWDRAMQARDSYVALLDKQIVGFSDVDPEGHIDMMFVSPRHSRRGVSSALLTHLHGHARAHGIRNLSADVSITARPFFEKHGFTVVTTQHPMTAGVPMTNFRMTEMLASARWGLPPTHMVTASTFAACSFGRKSDVGRADACETAVERASGDPHQCRSTGPLTADGALPCGNAPSPKLLQERLGNSNYYLWIAVASAWESSTAANSGLSS